jgi:hypothetical protein
MFGRSPRVKGFFGSQLAVGCKSFVRPVGAALMTAGPDVIRRSSPYHSPVLKSAWPNSGFSRSPVQPVGIKPLSPSTFLCASTQLPKLSRCQALQAATTMVVLLERVGAR